MKLLLPYDQQNSVHSARSVRALTRGHMMMGKDTAASYEAKAGLYEAQLRLVIKTTRELYIDNDTRNYEYKLAATADPIELRGTDGAVVAVALLDVAGVYDGLGIKNLTGAAPFSSASFSTPHSTIPSSMRKFINPRTGVHMFVATTNKTEKTMAPHLGADGEPNSFLRKLGQPHRNVLGLWHEYTRWCTFHVMHCTWFHRRASLCPSWCLLPEVSRPPTRWRSARQFHRRTARRLSRTR